MHGRRNKPVLTLLLFQMPRHLNQVRLWVVVSEYAERLGVLPAEQSLELLPEMRAKEQA